MSRENVERPAKLIESDRQETTGLAVQTFSEHMTVEGSILRFTLPGSDQKDRSRRVPA